MKNIFKKIISTFLSAATILTTAIAPLATEASAVSSWSVGDTKTVTRTGDFSDSSYHFNGRLGRGFWASSSPMLEINGQIAYCISSDKEAGGFNQNISYTIASKDSTTSTLAKALSYGYQGKPKYEYSDDYERNATQILVWMIMDGWYGTGDEDTALTIFTEEMSSAKRTAVKDIISKIKANMAEFGKTPSFNSTTVTNQMTYNSSTKKWTLTLTDTNKVANKFDWASAVKGYSYLSVSATASTVTFTSTKAFDTLTLKAEYNNSAYTDGQVFRLSPPTGYDIQDVATMEVRNDPPEVTVKLYAAPATGSCKLIKTSEDGKVEGIGFRVLKSSGTLIGAYYTDSKGTFTVNDLEAGTYIVSEIAQDGYVKQSDKTVTIKPGETAEVRFNNTLLRGSVKLIKTSEDDKIEGIGFRVLSSDGTIIGTYYTDANGTFTVDNLLAGTYTVSELPRKGYLKQNDQTVTIKPGETAEVRFNNTLLKGDLKLIKTSEDGIVSGIKFDIYAKSDVLDVADNTKIGTFTTDSNGEIFIPNLKIGIYTIIEISPDKYNQQDPQTVTITYNKTAKVSFHNTLGRGDVKIIKTSDDGKVSDISFIFTNEDGTKLGTYRTDSNGEILIPNLLPGTYVVTEVMPKNGAFDIYQPQEPKTVTVKIDETAVVKFHNSLIPGGIKIIKKSDDGNISGISFIISTENGTKIGTYTTDENGEFINPDIAPGTYIITEIVPEGYEPQEPQKVTVVRNVTTSVVFTNIPKNAGDLQIIKTSDDGKVSNIPFTIKTESGKLIGTFYTNVLGRINVKLVPGVYIVSEDANEMYEPQEPQRVTVQTGKTATVSFHNICKGGIQLTKVDENDTDKLLSGAVFKVLFSDKTSGGIGGFGPIKTPVGNMKEVSKGVYYIGNLSEGTYYITETKAPNGYDLDTNTYIVEVTNTNQSYIVTNGDDGLFTNHKQPQITTLAASQNGGNTFATGIVTIEDTVSYKNLIVGKTYTIKGTLMTPSFEWDNRETGTPFLVNGEQVTAEKTFTATSSEGSITLSFTFDTKEITQNTKVVVFERLYTTVYDKKTLVASHTDINDRDQTVEIHKPTISTTATSYNRKDVIGVGTITIDDSVEYNDLIVGEEYVVKGALMDKTTDKAFMINGKAVEAETAFIARATEGTIAVRFTFNANSIVDNTKVVAYERLYYNGIEIAAHTDINDHSQTVDILKPYISTTATSMNEKHAFGIGNVFIDDAVAYSNLIEEQEYTLVGVLMDRTTGQAFTVNGKTVEARTTFTAKAQSGTVAVRFAFDASGITANTKLVVYETLYRNGVEIASHKDINDAGQTVEIHKPFISTTATSDGEKEAIGVGTVSIDDVVTYKDLIEGQEYTINGILTNKITGQPFTVNGKEVTAHTKFTPTAASGRITVTFTFDASEIINNTKLVVYETLYYNGVEIANHKELGDAGQTVEIHKPKLSTTASVDGGKEAVAIGTVTVNDIVYYSDLIVGKKYTVIGTLMDKSTAAPFTVNGEEITAQAEFTPVTPSGSVTVTFTFGASGVTQNTTLVAFERLYLNGAEIAVHTNINDVGQTVKIHKPKISTTATSNGEKEVIAVGTITIDDVVSYSDLITEKEYTVNGTLMNKATGKPFSINGKEVTSSVKFTPTAASGTVAVKFTFDGSEVTANTELVVYESLYFGGKEIAKHTDINDEKQTVKVRKPSIGTTATSNGEKETIGVGTVTINDTVAYHDLIVGKEYTVSGVLMNKTTGKAFIVNGKEVTSSVKFTAEASDETVTVSFVFDGSAITANTKLVVFETLYLGGTVIAVHADISDAGQTVEIHKPSIGTTAASNGEKDVIAVGTVTVDDVISYSDLIIGKEYTVNGTLMNKATGKPFTVNGKEITAQAKFTPTAANGTVTVKFTFDGSAITSNTKLVAYERLYLKDVEIAVHTDINDQAQTVEIHKPSIGTTATTNGEKETIGIGTVTVNDTVAYHDLIVGKEYTVSGVLMNKATGKAFTVNGKEVTSTVKFTPTASDSNVSVSFTFDGSAVMENTKLVAFQTLYLNDVEIANHKDINDQGQTVEIRKPSIGTSATSEGEKETIAAGTVTINDVVSYKDLIIGKEYTVNGVLMNKATGKPFTVNGKEITSQVKFTPITNNGSVGVSFTFDASGITANTKLVAYERLSLNDVEIAVHTDINDTAQTVEVHKPEIGTSATSDGEKETIAVGTVTVDDIVSYKDLIVGKEYTVNGILMDKTTGQPFIVDGKEMSSQVKFTAATVNGEVKVTFTFDSSAITENTKLVVFESLYYKGALIASHNDINDEGQTVEVHKPEIGTTADSNGEKEAFAVGIVTINDIVKYHDLIVGKEYVVNGILMNKETNEPFIISGEKVTAQTTFVAETTDGEVTVTFVFDASEITENITVVAFETMSYDGVEFAVHADIDDEDQTVELKKPIISTVATINGEKDAFAADKTVVKDIISYQNLIIGKEYTVVGILMDPIAGTAFLVNGEQVTAQTTFIADSENGDIETSFIFDGKAITENTKLVVFETLYFEDSELTTHTDINDENQTFTVHKPSIGTTAVSNGEKEVIATGEISINDVVAYHDLIVGKEYVIKGTLMNKTTGEAFLVNGEPVTAETVFIAESADETVIVTFTFDSVAITENTKLVAFETLYLDDEKVTSHEDIEDEGQTVEIRKPEIGTTASSNGEKEVIAIGAVTIEDIVKYHSLIIGKEYAVNGVLINKATGEPFLVNGEQVTAQTTFTAETADGEVTVTFVFDASGITENMTVVAFETMSYDGVEFAVHADIDDENQTVKLVKPEVSTKASKDYIVEGDKFFIVVDDVITFTNFISGKEYTIKGVLMDKLTGQPFLVNGKQITVEKTFIAEAADGETTVRFIIDATDIDEEIEVVVFETVYLGEEKIAAHTDITDVDQTVRLIPLDEDVPLGTVPPTGVGIGTGIIGAFGLAAAAVAVFGKRRKK